MSNDTRVEVFYSRHAGGTTYVYEAWRVCRYWSDGYSQEIGCNATKAAAVAEARSLKARGERLIIWRKR